MSLRRSAPLLVLALLVPAVRAQSLRWTKDGVYGNAHFGHALAGAGDVNGDGYGDVLVGDPDAQPSFLVPGQVWVYSGADGAELHSFEGQTAIAGIGLDVAGVGDLDLDGYDDFVFTALEDYGELHSGIDGALIRKITAVTAFGQIVASVGDVDGDGLAELAVGTPSFSGSRGRIWLVRGSWLASGTGSSILFTVDGADPGGELGSDVADAGDVDADGVNDIVAGAPNEEGTGYAGAVYVISGATGAVLHHVKGPAADTAFGFAVGSAGDVDADGRADVLVGDFMADVGATNAGRVVIFSGADASVLDEHLGDDASDFLGRAVAGGVDLDGDHDPDLLLGANVDECAGSATGTARLLDGGTGAQHALLCGEAAASAFGTTIASIGDVGGDGLDDFAIAATDWLGVGRVYVYDSVCAGAIERYCDPTDNSSGHPGEIEAFGSTRIAQNDLTLRARMCPPNQAGIFYYGSGQTNVFVGDGVRCVGGATFRLNPPVQVNQLGRASRALDFTVPPLGSGAGEVVAGSRWNFQFWFRDPMGAGGGFNYTDALSIVFCP